MSEHSDDKQQGRRRGNSSEKELASQQIQINSKRFYIDVKENQRGRFIKLAEVGVGGRKSRILMTMNAAEELKKHLVKFSELHSSMSTVKESAEKTDVNEPTPVTNGNATEDKDDKDSDGLIKSETFIKDRKRYYMDLKENQRGRFLKVSMVVPGPRGARTQVAIPAQGLVEFKDQLADMLERYNTLPEGENSEQPENLPESKSLRADNKTFYFDCGSNPRGVFLKISEVRLNRYRTSITIPEKYLNEFAEQIKEFCDRSTLNTSNEDEASKLSTDAKSPSIEKHSESITNGVGSVTKTQASVVTSTEKLTAAMATTAVSETVN